MSGIVSSQGREPIRIEEDDQDRQRDEAEGEVRDPGHRRGDRQDELRELDLLDQPLGADDGGDAVADRVVNHFQGRIAEKMKSG